MDLNLYKRAEKRFLQDLDSFISELPENVATDIFSLPYCSEIDSIERYLDIYKEGLYNFSPNPVKGHHLYRKHYVALANDHGETILYLTKRKVEFLEDILSAFRDKKIKKLSDYFQKYKDHKRDNKELENFNKSEIENKLSNNEVSKDEIIQYIDFIKVMLSKEQDFNKVVEIYYCFFNNITCNPSEVIFIRNGNKKKLAFGLGQLFDNLQNKRIDVEYLKLAIKIFSVFKNEEINELDFRKSNLYKYLKTVTR